MRIATYNILATVHMRPDYFPKVAADLFDWERRRPALLARILGFEADVICLQEVEPGAFDELQAALRDHGYAGVCAQKAGRREGCATFLREARFAAFEHRALYYNDAPVSASAAPAGPSGHLALIVGLREGGRTVRIANTHLRWGRAGDRREKHIGYRQLRELLAVVAAEPGDWILCGDWNVTPDSDCVGLALAQGLVDAGAAAPYPTFSATGRPMRLDYIFHSPDLAVAIAPQPPIDAATVMPSPIEPSDHLPVVGAVGWAGATSPAG